MFAGCLDAVVDVDEEVPLERDIRAAVTIEAIGVVFKALTWIRYPAYVIDRVPTDYPVHSLVVADRTDAFVSNHVDADVVIVVNEVVGDSKIGHVTIHIQRLAVPGPHVVNFVAIDDQFVDGSLRRAVNGDAESIAVLLRGGRDVVHQIVQNPDSRARARNPYATGNQFGAAGSVVTDFKTTDDDVTQVSHDIDEPLCAGHAQAGPVDHRSLSGIALE